MINVEFVPVSPKFVLPKYATSGSACFDVQFLPFVEVLEDGTPVEIVLLPGQRVLLPLGFIVEVPAGYEMELRPRSGLAFKNGITVLNSPGCIDSDFRGEVQALVINHGGEPFTFTPGMRIAQAKISQVPPVVLSIKDTITQTDRASGGFGSTGIL